MGFLTFCWQFGKSQTFEKAWKCSKGQALSLNLENKLGESFDSKKPLIYLITSGNLTPQNFASESKNTLQIIEAAAKTKVSLVQIREKMLSADLVFKLASEVVTLSKDHRNKDHC